MCLFVYTLSLCNHTSFQNVAECPTARGLSNTSGARQDMTLSQPKFLFDTASSQSRTPEFYTAAFSCKKRRATRPVPTFCGECVEKQAGDASLALRKTKSLAVLSGVSRRRAAPGGLATGESSSSSLGTIAQGFSASDVGPLGLPTPRSFWKSAHPAEASRTRI